MSRPLRIQFPGAIYHVMNRGIAHQKIFIETVDYIEFLKTIAETHELWGIEVFAYCLMSSHVHICLRTPEGNLSRVMRHVDGLYTQRFNRMHGRDGPIFRGRYKAIVIDGDRYLAAVVRYIHLNPVDAGIVKEAEEYKWGSHKNYLKPKKAPQWLNVNELLEGFSNVGEFQEFVLSGNEDKLREFYTRGRQSPILGGEDFRERVREKIGKIGGEHPRHERVWLRPSVEEVVSNVARAYGTGVDEVLRWRRGRGSEARKVGMYLVKRLCDMTLNEVAGIFGVGSYGVVGWACNWVRVKMEKDKRFRKKVEEIMNKTYKQKI